MNRIAERRAAEKAVRFAETVARADAALPPKSAPKPDPQGEPGTDAREQAFTKAAAHAHVASHHAVKLDTPEAHKLAIQAHQAVVDLHKKGMQEAKDADEEGKPE